MITTTAKRITELQLSIYFSLTLKQKLYFDDNYVWHKLELITTNDFKRITSSKKLLDLLLELKALTIDLV